MLPLVTASQMKTIDRQAIEVWGIPGVVLMENAGRSVVLELEKEFKNLSGKKFLIICGKGNNGGDGFVVARHLNNKGAFVRCVLLGKVKELKGDALTNARILINAGMKIEEVEQGDELPQIIQSHAVIIDAIFGTGLSAPPQGIFAEAIRLINTSNAFVVSVDVPSGLDADTGKIFEPAVRAHLTVTMGLPKLGLFLYPGRSHTGKLVIADIGIPKQLIPEAAAPYLLDNDFVRKHLPARKPDGHKGTFGTCLLICGSRGYSGAACLASMAAVRAGAGLVHIAYPECLGPIIESQVLEPVKHPLPETPEGTLSRQGLKNLIDLAENADAIAIGPGISTSRETRELLLELFPKIEKPLILDADAINNLANSIELLKNLHAPVILTPHPGELSRLTDMPPAEINSNRVGVSRSFAQNHNCILVLKGAPTVIAAPDGKVYLNPTGNSGLATGGSGDVLTGLICGLIAQGTEPLESAICGVYLHGLAADIGAAEMTEYSLAASDLLKFLPYALRQTIDHPTVKI
ncbi:MAG: NAD(P)H-hydrate dehydratase [candidate division WOR-3 bacterium]